LDDNILNKEQIEKELKKSNQDRNSYLEENRNINTTNSDITRAYPIFDFSLPNRIQLEQIRTLRDLHDKISRTLSTRITALLNSAVEISFVGIDQMQYNEFTMSLSNPTSFDNDRQMTHLPNQRDDR